jgi:hypothetical protein
LDLHITKQIQSNTGKISKRQISEQFSQGLSNLLNKGLVVESNKKTSLYKVVDEQRLAELIVDIISDMLYQTRHQLGKKKTKSKKITNTRSDL